MSSNERNTGSKPLLREGDLTNRELLTRGWSQQGGGEKLSMDSNHARLWGTVGLSRRGAVAAFCKVAFSSLKAALAAKKEANCY